MAIFITSASRICNFRIVVSAREHDDSLLLHTALFKTLCLVIELPLAEDSIRHRASPHGATHWLGGRSESGSRAPDQRSGAAGRLTGFEGGAVPNYCPPALA